MEITDLWAGAPFLGGGSEGAVSPQAPNRSAKTKLLGGLCKTEGVGGIGAERNRHRRVDSAALIESTRRASGGYLPEMSGT